MEDWLAAQIAIVTLACYAFGMACVVSIALAPFIAAAVWLHEKRKR